jgi:hypothetical protein
MRVMYISHTLDPASGVAFKVAAMAAEWERVGHSVFIATPRDPTPLPASEVIAGFKQRSPARSLPQRVQGEVNFRLAYPALFIRACDRLAIDVNYVRELPPAPGLRALIKSRPFVMEVNGNVSRERKGSWEHGLRTRSYADQLQRADGVVFVSRALRDEVQPPPRRTLVVGNPCLPTEYRAFSGPRPARPTLVLIGHGKHPWSGIDKFVALATALPDLDFVVIGDAPSGPPNLRCFAELAQAEADRVMSECTLGVGPLATHRPSTYEASPLKSRNYLALGLPLIQAYEDTDLTEPESCILQLPNCEDNVLPHAARIREFALRAYEDASLSRRALELAHGRLSLAAKEGERLAFIESCLAR